MTGAPAQAGYAEYLAAIHRAPEDDAPRVALADFVRPSEPDLAAFITLQLAAARRERKPYPPGLTEPSAEERRLLARNGAAWTRLVAPHVVRNPDGSPACTFHRGLVAHVVVEPEAFLAGAEQLLAIAPIRHVDFTPPRPGALAALLAAGALARLDSIGFPAAALGDDDAAAIAACPHLAECLYLDLGRGPVGPRGFEALVVSPYLRRLLVVERGGAWHPGEVVVSEVSAARTRAVLQPVRPEGRALEAEHGYVPWLHLDNRVARLDARWFVEQGLRPVSPAAAESAGAR